MKTIYYYQTFVGLKNILSHPQDIDVIIISSIHFDNDINQKKSLYLNDNKPHNPIFNQLWTETEKLSYQGTTIMLMVGGAGGAYKNLFNDFNIYYPMLQKLITEKSWIQGIDLDIEESVSLQNVQMLINQIVKDFGEDFIITMAPIASSLINDGSSLSGINYKELYQSKEGKYIHWFNTQCYDSFSYKTYHSIICNGYPPEKIIMGMESGQFNEQNFSKATYEVYKTQTKYPKMLGVYDWEYLNAPPDKNDPSQWAKLMKKFQLKNKL